MVYYPCVTLLLRLASRPTTKVAVWGPLAKCRPMPTKRVYKVMQFSLVREGGRLAEGPRTATLVVGREAHLIIPSP